ncbi:MAG: hypothetical protein QME13_06140, partial [Thermoanaerobacteraceae bacterium]|nr:hypothetical protein [Thermoanaerobacteraceae bacterium]
GGVRGRGLTAPSYSIVAFRLLKPGKPECKNFLFPPYGSLSIEPENLPNLFKKFIIGRLKSCQFLLLLSKFCRKIDSTDEFYSLEPNAHQTFIFLPQKA